MSEVKVEVCISGGGGGLMSEYRPLMSEYNGGGGGGCAGYRRRRCQFETLPPLYAEVFIRGGGRGVYLLCLNLTEAEVKVFFGGGGGVIYIQAFSKDSSRLN